ncbi:MAG: hypothetical protein ACLR23_14030 [Clostridia bacterium]
MHAGEVRRRQRPACKRRQSPRRQRAKGGKIPAGMMKKGRRPACKGGKFLAVTVETIMPTKKQNEKSPPAGSLPIYVGAGRSFSRQPFF